MKFSSRSVAIRYLGAAVAVLVPALVLAQTIPDFSPGNVLRARDLQLLSDALRTVLSNVADLENRVGNLVLSKDRVYPVTGPVTVASGAAAAPSTSCEANADIMLTCGCDGNGSSRMVVHTLTVTGSDNAAARTTCTCNMVSSGTTIARAVATCLRVE